MWLRGRLLTFIEEIQTRLLNKIEMVTIDSIVQLATFFGSTDYCLDKVRQRVLLTMDGLETAAVWG